DRTASPTIVPPRLSNLRRKRRDRAVRRRLHSRPVTACADDTLAGRFAPVRARSVGAYSDAAYGCVRRRRMVGGTAPDALWTPGARVGARSCRRPPEPPAAPPEPTAALRDFASR